MDTIHKKTICKLTASQIYLRNTALFVFNPISKRHDFMCLVEIRLNNSTRRHVVKCLGRVAAYACIVVFLITSQHIIMWSTYCGLPILLTARLAAPEVADRDLAESVLSSTYWGREDDLDLNIH